MTAPRRTTLGRLATIAIVSLTVAACGTNATQAPQATTASQSEAQAATAPAATPEPAQPSSNGVELTMWTWKLAHVPALQQIAKDYEAKTGVKVTVSAYNPDEVYRTKITTAAQSGDLPDILSYWSNGQWDLAATDQLVELTSVVDKDWQANFLAGTYDKVSVYPQGQYDQCQKDPKCTHKNINVGQSFSVPYVAGQAYFVFANKEMLKAAGLDPEKAPTTAEEWMDMMKAVKEKTQKAALVTGVQNPDVLHFWLYNPLLIASCGTETYDKIYNGTDSFGNDCSLKVLNWINDIAANDLWTADILQTNIDPADVAFSQGKAAFDIGGTYTLGFLISQGMSPDNILSFAIPPLQGSKYSKLDVSASPLIDAMVTKSSKHQQEAIDFLKFLTSPDEMTVFAKTANDLPAVKVSSDPDKVGSVMVGLLKALADKSPFTDSKAQILDEPAKVLKVGLQQFITKETTPADLVKKIDDANKAAWDARGGPKQ
jgi:ABC-type glycerol-3-phosphate transport system substrate-binding protein